MRNAVAHGYFKVDLDLVWRTIERDLPGLARQVEAAVDDLSRDPGGVGPSREQP
ncbi:MAG: DUF86 domain-containing protein [Gammaproteobacteria bacterium]